jgi:opacity protein-like surface antigen
MREYLLAAAAATAIATPAVARDESGYVGIEGGAMVVQDMDHDLNFEDEALGSVDDLISIDHKYGVDIDAIAGYDFGMVRAEAELGWKRASHDEYDVGGDLFDGDGRTSVLSLMGNVLLDFGNDDSWSGYVGGGVGLARTRVQLNDVGRISDTGFAWQSIAGVRHPISDNIDVGLKYRFFNAKVDDSVDLTDLDFGPGDIESRFRSHSLLASLIFNFGAPPAPPPPAPPPPPPPAPPAPATQTCPDGSVILATDTCPVPPPPPPPPTAQPERG